jgi:threonine aldolase
MNQVDLRSDTVTRPSKEMLQAMMTAEVGDVVFYDDPTVNRLEAYAADLFGKEAAMYVPTGSMANQIGIGLHVGGGDAIMLEERAHIRCWEGSAASAFWGAQLVTVPSEDGLPTPEALEAKCFPKHPKAPRIKVLAMENTHNGAGGIAHSPDALAERASWARSKGFGVHIDGARLFNAAEVFGVDISAYTEMADTVSICLSKGLGAPVGSIVAGTREAMEEADRLRHRLGGGWRQAGFIAAAGLFALQHNVKRLGEDHRRAQALVESMAATGIARPTHPVMTNILYYDVDSSWGTAEAFRDLLAERGVLVTALGPQLGRMVTHLDVDDDDILKVQDVLKEMANG